MTSYAVVQNNSAQQGAGPTLTAAAAAEMILAQARWPWSPSPQPKVGDIVRFTSRGIISCVVTTPGTARFDIRTAPSGGIVIADSGAIALNTTAKTNVPYWLDVELRVLTIGNGTIATVASSFRFESEAVNGAAAGLANTVLIENGAGTGFDSTVTNNMTAFFTQTVATGSFTAKSAAFYLDT